MPLTDRACRIWREHHANASNDQHWTHGEHNISEQHDPTSDHPFTYDLWWVASDRSDYCYLGTYSTFIQASDAVPLAYTDPKEVMS